MCTMDGQKTKKQNVKKLSQSSTCQLGFFQSRDRQSLPLRQLAPSSICRHPVQGAHGSKPPHNQPWLGPKTARNLVIFKPIKKPRLETLDLNHHQIIDFIAGTVASLFFLVLHVVPSFHFNFLPILHKCNKSMG